MIITAFSISLAILGFHYTFESFYKNVLGLDFDTIYDKLGRWSMPLIYCPTCMTSLWGVTLLYFSNLDYTAIQYILTLFQIGFINYVVSKHI